MSTVEKPLAEKVALVTGGSRGIGAAISLHLAALGATVAVNYSSNSGKAEEVVAEIEKAGGKAFAIGFDVSDASAVDAAVSEVIAKAGGLHILVNNAGISIDSLIARAKPEDWQRTIDVNLSGVFYCSKAVAKPMMKAREGRIINISSVVGEAGNAGQVAYSAAKAGIFGITKSLAKELGSRSVTVNAVAPGYIKTDMTAGMSETMTEALLKEIPLNRLGESEDIAALVAFLASPSASYITGQTIGVNGGMHM